MLFAHLIDMRSMLRRMIILVNLIRGKVADVNVGAETGFKGCANITKLLKDDALEEGMGSNLGTAGCSV